ncbi:acyltransferase [Bdellovibrio sp. HCB337]|uniref:acyltransferase n=1 Tax=Bdellovibrio sp. HCB337 TaxID=3394358 RepID=UPI0039A566D5
MPNKNIVLLKFIIGNFIPALQLAGLIIFCWVGTLSITWTLIWVLVWIYLVPPFCVRLIYLFFGRPEGTYYSQDRHFWVWYFGSQFQALYLRFPFLEEVLRVFPVFYSVWLRMWGAKIGKYTYWSPDVVIMDRTHLVIGDKVIVGYGAGFTAHHLNRTDDKLELIVASPRVEDRAILGGKSGMTPGSVVCEGETLPSTMGLAPFYVWKNGRRQSKP